MEEAEEEEEDEELSSNLTAAARSGSKYLVCLRLSRIAWSCADSDLQGTHSSRTSAGPPKQRSIHRTNIVTRIKLWAQGLGL